MKAHFITLFPEIIEVSVNSGITGKAIKTSLIDVETLNPRKFLASNERVDDKIYGGGPGMLLKAQPINDAIKEIKEKIPGKSKVIFLSPRGKVFNQEKAKNSENISRFYLQRARGFLKIGSINDAISDLTELVPAV